MENNAFKTESGPEQTDIGLTVAERLDTEVLDSVIGRCKTINDALVLSMQMGGYNIKELSYLIGYEAHPESVSRMLNPDGPFPAKLLNLFMDKVGNEIPLRYLAHSRGYGLIRLQYVVERENEQLKSELEKRDERISYLEGLLQRSA